MQGLIVLDRDLNLCLKEVKFVFLFVCELRQARGKAQTALKKNRVITLLHFFESFTQCQLSTLKSFLLKLYVTLIPDLIKEALFYKYTYIATKFQPNLISSLGVKRLQTGIPPNLSTDLDCNTTSLRN